MLPKRCCVALCFGAIFSIVLANEVVDNVGTTTERHESLSSFDRVLTRIEMTKDRIAKVLNESRQNDVKSLHELLIGRDYQYTSEVGYHKLYRRKLSWHDAMQRCRAEDAHLAIIDSSAEAVVSIYIMRMYSFLFPFELHTSIYCLCQLGLEIFLKYWNFVV